MGEGGRLQPANGGNGISDMEEESKVDGHL